MRFRVLGALLLVALVTGVLMTMGCEKGALGVKSSTVLGRIVDSTSNTIPVVGGKITMTSSQGVTGGAEKQTGFQYVTVSGANGQFIFENVAPDQLQMMIDAIGYSGVKYPSASSTTPFFYVGNGVTLNLGDISMSRIAHPLNRTTITVRAVIVDANSKDELADTKVLSFYVGGEKYQNRDITYLDLKNGLTLPAALLTYGYTIIAQNYKTYEVAANDPKAINASVDNVLSIELTPITYNVRLTFRNKPFYINNQVRELNAAGAFATGNRNKCTITITSAPAQANKPPKILATGTVDLTPYEPELTLAGISLPASVTVLLSGYREMVFPVPYTPDTQGLIAMMLSLEAGALSFGIDIDSNKIFRPTIVNVHPDGDNIASPPIALMVTDQVRVRVMQYEWGLAPLNSFFAEALNPTIRNVPCGYVLPFEVHARLATGYHDTTNYVYLEPVHVPVGVNTLSPATFTANLLISPKSHVVRP